MKTLNRTIVITVMSILTVCLLGLFLAGRFYFVDIKQLFNSHNTRFRNYTEAFTIAIVLFTIAWVIKQIQNKIGTSHKQYYNLFENNPIPMVIADKETARFLAVNKATIAFYGYTAHEFLSMKTSDIWIKNDRLTELGINAADCNTHEAHAVRHRKKNGEVVLTEVSCTEVIFKNKNCRMFLARDITEMVKAKEDKRIAEEENVKQKKFTSYVLENFPVDVAVFNKDHRYIFLNKIAVKNDEMRKWMIGKTTLNTSQKRDWIIQYPLCEEKGF